jgi:signal transduction histidine kinase
VKSRSQFVLDSYNLDCLKQVGFEQESIALENEDHSGLLRQYHELAELAGSLAHEIKNPLSVIHMNADLLGEELLDVDWPGRKRAEAKVNMIRQQCERMENLLRDFLRFSRMRDLEMTPGDLNEQVETVLRLYEAQAEKEGIEVLRYLDAGLPSILLHSDSLQASLMNLVKNAFEAMSNGGQFVVRTYTTPRGVALDLIDTGIGVEDSTAMHMFEPFYSTKNGGSGLGLPTARKIIEAHGGRISVQSEVGRGTKFVLEFPTPARLS